MKKSHGKGARVRLNAGKKLGFKSTCRLVTPGAVKGGDRSRSTPMGWSKQWKAMKHALLSPNKWRGMTDDPTKKRKQEPGLRMARRGKRRGPSFQEPKLVAVYETAGEGAKSEKKPKSRLRAGRPSNLKKSLFKHPPTEPGDKVIFNEKGPKKRGLDVLKRLRRSTAPGRTGYCFKAGEKWGKEPGGSGRPARQRRKGILLSGPVLWWGLCFIRR